MGLVDYYKHGAIEVRRSRDYAFVCCPLMDRDVSFSEKRMLYNDFKALEIQLQMDEVNKIVGYTRVRSSHMMIMFGKLGYEPFHINIDKKIIWFKKEL